MSYHFFAKLREKFAFQLFAAFTLLVFFITLFFLFVGIQLQYAKMISGLERQGKLMAEMMAHQSRLGLFAENKKMLQRNFEALFKYEMVLEASLFDQNAKTVVEKKNNHLLNHTNLIPDANLVIKDVVKHFSQSPSTLVFNYKNNMEVWAPVQFGNTFGIDEPVLQKSESQQSSMLLLGYVRVLLSKNNLKKELWDARINTIGVSVVFWMLGALAAFFLARQINKPIKQLVAGVHRFSTEGDCGALPLTTRNEIGGLAKAFQGMGYSLAQHIQRQIDTTRELAHAKNLAELGAASSKIAHEVGNLLNNMELVISTLNSESLSNHGKKRLEILEKDAYRVKMFISDFLQFARDPALRMQKMSMDLIIKEVLTSHAAQAEGCGICLELDWPCALPPITMDRQMIYQAFTNLLKNSLEAIGKCGTVKISGQATDQDIIVIIEDTGPGIEPADLEKLFKPFFTTKGNKGTGLGLSIVKGIVQAHGGAISCYSTLGKGARFSVTFPIK